MRERDDDDEEPESRSRLRTLLGLLAVVVLALGIAWWPGCRQYPPVTSRESLSQMKLLYTACNTRDAKRLAAAERGVAQLDREEKLSEAEKEAFHRILALAKAGDWQVAEAESLRFAQDQLRR